MLKWFTLGLAAAVLCGGDVPLNVENCGSGLASFDDYAAFDVSSSPKWLA